jgi:nucleotide-binding universal stress UspA family protein
MKIRKIAVGMDEEAESIKALEEVMPVARKCGAEIVLVHVGNLYDSFPDSESFVGEAATYYQDLLNSRQAATREALAEIRERHSGQGVEKSVSLLAGFPDSAITDAEEEIDADLIVVGSHGRTGLRRLLAGSVAERIARRSERMVLVARKQTPGPLYERILVATDFSAAAEQALDAALVLAAPNANVTLFHSWQLPHSAAGINPGYAKLSQTIEESANERAAALKAKYEGDYVIGTEITFGHPGSQIRERADDLDLIALGSHGRHGLRRFLLGSVAELTIRHAPCSVLVAHGPTS